MKTINLISGASGFLGSHLAHGLLKHKQAVRALVRKTSNTSCLPEKDVEFIIGNLENRDSLNTAMKNVTTVFHCAALVSDWGKKKDFINVNVEGTRNMLDAAVKAKVKRFVYVSTSDFYGFLDKEDVTEDTPPKKRGFLYGDTKIMAEELVWQYHKEKGLKISIIRPPSIYGPRSLSIVKEFADLINSGQMLHISKGKKIAGLCHIDNLVEGLIQVAGNKNCIGQAYNISDGSKVTWNEFVAALCDILGKKHIRFSIPRALAYPIGFLMEKIWGLFRIKSRPLLTRMAVELVATHQDLSIQKAIRDFNYNPAVNFKQGMEGIQKWLDEIYGTNPA